jgi:hypothetical protein
MKDITLTTDESLMEAASVGVRIERITLNEEFRQWLGEYTATAANECRNTTP